MSRYWWNRPFAQAVGFLLTVYSGLLLVGVLLGAGEVTGNLGIGTVKDQHIATGANIATSKIVQRALVAFPIKLLDLREWDTLSTLLPSAATGTYLGLVTGTFGSNCPQVQTGDLHAAGATTRRARTILAMPDNFISSGNVVLRSVAGMTGHVADTSATILIEAYQLNDDGTLSTQLVTTSAVTINSLTLANQDFTVTSSNLVAGSRLDVRVSITVTDAAGASAVTGVLQNLVLRCDVQP